MATQTPSAAATPVEKTITTEPQPVAAEPAITTEPAHAPQDESTQPQPPATQPPPPAIETDNETTTSVQEKRRTLEPALPVERSAIDKEPEAGALSRKSQQTDNGGGHDSDDEETVNPPDFHGDVLSNDELPSAETIERISDYIVLDRHGKTHTFRSLYTGRSVARRVLIIFVRHFYCGVCHVHSAFPIPYFSFRSSNANSPVHRTAKNTCAPSPPPSTPTRSSTSP